MKEIETIEMTFEELVDVIIKNNLKVEYDKNENLEIHINEQEN